MSLLTRDERRALMDYLLRLPNVGDAAMRRLLLADLPGNLRDSIEFAGAPAVHIANIVTMVDSDAWAVLPDGSRPLFTVIENAADLVRGARLESELRALLGTLRARAGSQNAAGNATPLSGTSANRATGPAGAQLPAAQALSGRQQQQLQKALLSAFPNLGDLARMVRFGLDQNLATIAGGDNLSNIAFNLIEWAESQGSTRLLIRAATDANPNNPKLRAFVNGLAQSPAVTPNALSADRHTPEEIAATHNETQPKAPPAPASPQDNFRYDAFISYSSKDKTWVRGTLLPRLERADLRVCIDYRDFELGVPSLVNIENAIQRSRKTLLVLTPNWVASQWTDFEGLLVQTLDPAAQRRRILPLLVEPAEIPSRLKLLTYLDLTDPDDREMQMPRLVQAIRDTPAQ